jgi:phosphoglycerate-specific signal transduction histidine kinase
MNINVENAINLFFPNPSLESVYFEAIANAVDANATNIWIDLSITDFNDVSTFELQITDNGDGFTEKNFYKFSNLLEVDEKTIKA